MFYNKFPFSCRFFTHSRTHLSKKRSNESKYQAARINEKAYYSAGTFGMSQKILDNPLTYQHIT